MEVKPGYKKTEIGLIPENWEVSKTGELFAFKNGLNKSKENFGHGTPIVNYMDVFKKPFLLKKDISGRVLVNSKEKLAYSVQKGDVFFTRTSETAEEIGITSVMLEETENTVYSGFVLRARPISEKLIDNFKAYCFSANYYRKQVVSKASYTTRALTSGKALSKTIVAIPPKNEQNLIAEALGDMDALLESLNSLVTKKRAIKQATMQQLLSGKTRLPGFKNQWNKLTLGQHLKFLRNGTNSRAELTDNEGVRYLHYGDIHTSPRTIVNIKSATIPFLPKNKAIKLDRLKTGDLVFADASEDTSGIGKSIEINNTDNIEIVSGLHTIAVRFDNNVLANGFKSCLQFIPEFRKHLLKLSSGTKVYATNRSSISRAQILLPDLNEQTEIYLSISDIDNNINALEARYQKTLAIKKAMMQELLTGRIRLV